MDAENQSELRIKELEKSLKNRGREIRMLKRELCDAYQLISELKIDKMNKEKHISELKKVTNCNICKICYNEMPEENYLIANTVDMCFVPNASQNLYPEAHVQCVDNPTTNGSKFNSLEFVIVM